MTRSHCDQPEPKLHALLAKPQLESGGAETSSLFDDVLQNWTLQARVHSPVKELHPVFLGFLEAALDGDEDEAEG